MLIEEQEEICGIMRYELDFCKMEYVDENLFSK